MYRFYYFFLAYKLIKKNKKILIVTSDTYSKFINSKDRSTIPLFNLSGFLYLSKYSKKGMVLKNSIYTTNKTIEDLCCKLNGSKKFEIKNCMNGFVLSFAIWNYYQL